MPEAAQPRQHVVPVSLQAVLAVSHGQEPNDEGAHGAAGLYRGGRLASAGEEEREEEDQGGDRVDRRNRRHQAGTKQRMAKAYPCEYPGVHL